MEILSETRISQQVITRISRIPLTRRPLELGPHRPPGEIRITTLELGNIELRPIDLDSRTIRPAPRRRLPRPCTELRTSNLIIRMLIQILFSTDLTNTRRRLINITPRISRIPSRSPELVDLVRVNVIFQALESVFPVGGVEVAPGAAFGHMRIEPAQCLITCLYVAGAVFEQLGNGLVMVGRTAVTGTRLVRIRMVMVSTVAVIAVVHRVIVRPVPVGISGSIGITSSIRRVVLLRRIQSPGLIGPRALGTGVLRLTALGAAVVAGPSRRVTATRAIRALVGPGPRTMSPTSTRMRGRTTQPAGMRSTTKSMSSTSPRHTQPSRTSHSSTSRMSRRRTPTMRPTAGIGMRSLRTTAMTATSIRMDRRRRTIRMTRNRRTRPRTTTMTRPASGGMRSPRTTDMTTTGIRMDRRRRGARMRGSRPTTSTTRLTDMTGPTLARMTGPAGIAVTGAGVAMAGSAAGVGVRGLGTAARVTTAPAGIAVTGPPTGSVRVRGLGTTGMTATSIRMRGSRPIAGMAGPTGALARMTGPAGVGTTGAGVAMAGSAAGGIRVRGSRPIASMAGPAGVGVTGAGVGMASSAAGGIGVRGFRTTARVTTAPAGIAVASSTAGGIGMRSPRITGMTATGIRMRGSRPIAGTTGPTGTITDMTGPAGTVASVPGPAGIAVAGSAAGGIGGMTGPAGVGMAGSAAGGIGMRSPRITGMTATGIRMRGRRIRCRVRGSRPIAGMTGSAGVAVTGPTGAAGVAGAGVGMAGPAAGVGVRGFGTAARVAAAPAGVGVAGPAGAGVAGAAGVGAGGGVGGCCGGVDGLGGLGVGMAGNGIETVISSHARTSTSRRGVGRCSRHCWNGARERIQTMISPRTRPGRRTLVTTATGGRARLGIPALGADPTITASARARPSRLTTVTAAGRLTTGRLTAVPSGVMPAAGVRMTRPG